MSITITGGFTMTGGGFTLVAAPPAAPTAGWFIGGRTSSAVQRVTYASDTATATVRGSVNLSADNSSYGQAAVTDNTTYGWIAGSNNPISSAIQRLTYASDTDTPILRGPLSSAKGYLEGVCNSTYGWFGGGNPGPLSTVDRIEYATDTATASVRGSLNRTVSILGAAGTDTDGWFAGGNFPTVSSVSRINYATDTATATSRGPLSSSRYSLSGVTDNTTYGWFGGGMIYPGPGFLLVSTIDRITYATDTVTASVRGSLASARYQITSTSGVQ